MGSYIALYRQVKAEFAQSPKSQSFWDTGNAVAGKLLYRPLGFLLAPIFIKLSISANQVTFLACLLGMLGNGFFLLGDPRLFLLAALCLVGFVALDFTDGLVARHEKKSTYFGKMLDFLSGLCVSSFAPVCVGFGVATSEQLPLWLDAELLYVFLAALATIINLMAKFLAASFSLEIAKAQDKRPKKVEESQTIQKGFKFVVRRGTFHLTSATSQLALLFLTVLNLVFLFPLALLLLAMLQLILILLEVFRTGQKVLATEKP